MVSFEWNAKHTAVAISMDALRADLSWNCVGQPCIEATDTVDTKFKRATVAVSMLTSAGELAIRVSRQNRSTNKPFYLSCAAPHAAVHIELPRSFHGLITIYAPDTSTAFSDQITSCPLFTVVSQTRTTSQYFIGDLWSEPGNESVGNLDLYTWQGDEVIVEARLGSVQISLAGKMSVLRTFFSS